MSVLLRNAKVVYPGSNLDGHRIDIRIGNGIIESIEEASQLEHKTDDDLIEDAFVAPSFVDGWCHSGEPGYEYRETFTSLKNLAQSGGFGHIYLLPNLKPSFDHRTIVESILVQNRNNSVKFWPYGSISIGAESEELSEMMDIHQLGITSFTDGIKSGHSMDFVIRVLEYLRTFGGRLHYAVNDIEELSKSQINQSKVSTSMGFSGQPKMSEISKIKQLLDAAIYTSGKLHLANISCQESVDLIREFRKKNDLDVTCSVAVMNLLQNEEVIDQFDENLKLIPPLRSELDRQALVHGIQDGTIDCINTNHTPLSQEEKMMEFAYADFGCISMQTMFAELKKLGSFSNHELIQALAIKPREIFGLKNSDWIQGTGIHELIVWKDEEWTYTRSNNLSKSENTSSFGKSYKHKIINLYTGRGMQSYQSKNN